jgi:predicted P-loop ATPase
MSRRDATLEFGEDFEDGKAQEWADKPEGFRRPLAEEQSGAERFDAFMKGAVERQEARDERAAAAAANIKKQLGRGKIPKTLANTVEMLELMRIDVRFNLLEERIEVGGDCLNFHGKIAEIKYEMSKRYEFEPPEDNFKVALRKVASDHAYHPVVEWLDGLPKWDGVKRIDTVLIKYAGADDTELVRAMTRKALIAAVRRARQPGCKWDYVLILEGDQGIGKSTMILVLAVREAWYGETRVLGETSKVVQELVGGKWFYELGEMGGLTARAAENVKQMITQRVDRGRKAYGEFPEDQARKGTFWGTKNPKKGDGYLVDETGNRRFWPVVVRGVIDDGTGKLKIDIEGLKANLPQLWAEAVAAEAAGEELFLPPELERLAEIEQAKRMVADAWEPVLVEALDEFMGRSPVGFKLPGYVMVCEAGVGKVEWRVSTKWLFRTALDVHPDQHAKLGGRLRLVMEKLGWRHHEKTLRIGSVVCNGYTRIGDPVCKKPAVTSITSEPDLPASPPVAPVAAPKLVVNNEAPFRRRVFKD